ncbi:MULTISPECIES: ATP-binding cassette domain-containing protein [unclassified Nonomuraea]|uniref:ABC transporter ATP-binding protein n=1 Tax=unclassified Nonomuraea TaxID=2593643 RepID=UPI00340016B6
MYAKSVIADDLHVALGGDPVLQRFALSASPGEIVAVVGPNGSGKSTLLRCLTGLQPADRGRVTVFGAAPADDATFWRDVALLTDEPAWYPGLTSREHLELVEAVHGTPRMTAGTALDLFEPAGRADAPSQNLSTGQRQRAGPVRHRVRPGPGGGDRRAAGLLADRRHGRADDAGAHERGTGAGRADLRRTRRRRTGRGPLAVSAPDATCWPPAPCCPRCSPPPGRPPRAPAADQPSRPSRARRYSRPIC